MRHRIFLLITTVIVVFFTWTDYAYAQKVPINPNDQTRPIVEIKVRGTDGQYTPASTASLYTTSGSLDLLTLATDPQGIYSISIDFLGQSKSCTLSGGAFYNGSFPILGLPAPLKQTLKGDASGNVLTKLPLLATIKTPLTCKVLGNPTQTGYPIGSKVTVQVVGRNWSSNDQTKTTVKNLTVTLK